MEEVISNSHGTGLLFVNSDPIILNDVGSINTLINNNGNLIQGTLNLIEPTAKSVSDSLKLNLVNNDATKDGEGGCIIVDNPVKLDGGNIIQLSLEDLNKLGLQLTFDNGDPSCDLVKANNEAVSGDLFLSTLTQSKDKLFLSAHESVSGTNLEQQLSLNVSQPLNITNFSSVLDENTLKGLTFQQLEVVSPFENENMTYTLQLDNSNSNIINRAASLAQTNTSVTPSNEALLVSDLSDNNVNKLSVQDQLHSDGKYPQIFKINTKPSTIDLKPKTFIKSVTNGIHNSVLTKVNDDKTKLVKLPKGQSLIVKNRNSTTNIKLNQPNTTNIKLNQPNTTSVKLNQPNVSSMNNKTKRICILNKNVSGIQSFEKSEPISKLMKVSTESIVNKNDVKPIVLSSGSNLVRFSTRSEPLSTPAASSSTQDPSKATKAKRLTPSQFQQIAAYLEKNRDAQGMITNPSTFYDTETNTKIICRVVYPEDFENGKNLKKTKKATIKPPEKELLNDTEVLTLLSFSRTRSGRLSRPPRHITVDQDTTDIPATTHTDNSEHLEPEFVGGVGVSKLNGLSNKVKAPKEVSLPKKGVSWKKRMKAKNGAKPVPLSEVLGKYSEVEIGDAIKNGIAKLSLWQCLLHKVSSSPEKDKVRLLCDEITSFAKSLASAASQFLKPISPETAQSSFMLKSDVLCALFQKNKGVYSCDDDALLRLYGDKRKREEDKETLASKKSKSNFGVKKESLSQTEVKEESSLVYRITPTSINGVKSDVKPSLDLDLGESVDELVNARLASLEGDLVPSQPSKVLPDDLLSNLLSRSDNKKPDKRTNNIKNKINLCLEKKGGKTLKFDNKSICEVKGSIDLDLGESVDELVNARLASLVEEIVPSLPSRALGDDVLVGLLSDPSSSLFSHTDKRVTSSTPTVLISDDPHTTSGIFSSLDKDISVSSRNLRESQTSPGRLFSSLDKRVSPPALLDTQSSSDLFSSLGKQVSPSESLLGDPQTTGLFSSLSKSVASSGTSGLLMDAQSSTGIFSTIDKCVSTPDPSNMFSPLEKRVSSPCPGLLADSQSSSNIFSSLDKCISSRGLLRSAQSSAGMFSPLEKCVTTRGSLLSDTRNSTILFSSMDKHVTSSSAGSSLLNGAQTSSDLFSPLDKRVSASTEDLIKSLENLSAEIPAPSSASLQDFSVFSQHFSRESKTAI